MNVRLCVLLFCLVPLLINSAMLRIGNEARQTLPDIARHNRAINWLPATNETVYVDPPLYSWPAMSDPAFYALTYHFPYTYVAQWETNLSADFSTPYFQWVGNYNFYNFLAPFGSPSVKMRIGYVLNTLTGPGTTTNWSGVRTQFIAVSAVPWDRSLWTNANYIATNLGVHPNNSFLGKDRVAYHSYLTNCETKYHLGTGTADERKNGYTFFARKQTASNTIISCWWTLDDPSTNNGSCSAIDNATWFDYASDVSFLSALTRDPFWTNALPRNAANRAAVVYLYYLWDQFSNINIFGCCSGGMNEVRGLGKMFDWNYNDMTYAQVTNMVASISGASQWLLKFGGNSFLLNDWVNLSNSRITNRVETNSFTSNSYVNAGSILRIGTSHEHSVFQGVFDAALSIYAHDSDTNLFPQRGNARLLVELGINWMWIKSYWAGWDYLQQSLGYQAQDVQNNRTVQTLLRLHIATPAMQHWRTPWLTNGIKTSMKVAPVGFYGATDSFGEGGGETIHWSKTIYRNWSYLVMLVDTNLAGQAYLQYSNSLPYYAPPYYVTPPSELEELSVGFFTNAPLPQLADTNPAFHPRDGFVAFSQNPANTLSGWSNGMWLMTIAPPQGGLSGAGAGSHSYHNAANIAAAYEGGLFAISGKGDLGQEGYPSWMHNTVAVNGLGQGMSSFASEEYLSFVSYYTNAADRLLIGMNLTYAYPHNTNYIVGQGPSGYDSRLNYGALSYLTNMERFVYVVKRSGVARFLSVYDRMGATTNSTWSWVWHVPMSTLSVSTNGMWFAYPYTNMVGLSQTCLVAHVGALSNTMTLTNLTGTNIAGNPITLENYAWTPLPRKHAFWIANATPNKEWHFHTIIIPNVTDMANTRVDRLSDNTASVVLEGITNVISWGETNGLSTDIIDVFNAPSGAPSTISRIVIGGGAVVGGGAILQ